MTTFLIARKRDIYIFLPCVFLFNSIKVVCSLWLLMRIAAVFFPIDYHFLHGLQYIVILWSVDHLRHEESQLWA